MKALINNARRNLLTLNDLVTKQSERYQNQKIGFHDPFYDPKEFEFIHIPKCAGTSLAEALLQLPGIGDHKHRPIAMCDLVKIYNKQPIKTKYITVIRNPVERVWSYYNMISVKGHYAWGRYTNSLNDFLANCWEVNNMMIQYLACKPREKNLDFADFEMAKTVLSKFYFVLDMSQLNKDFCSLNCKLKEDFKLDLGSLPLLNKATRYKSPTEEQVRKIQIYNQLDLKLYKELFPQTSD